MSGCSQCGAPTTFRTVDGRAIPIGLCNACAGGGAFRGNRLRHSNESDCRSTRCPKCRASVFFVRHNGGSVWLDPPLGPPWPIHPCMLVRPGQRQARYQSTAPALIHPQLAARLLNMSDIITGVVTQAEISADRRETLLGIQTGTSPLLRVLVQGGAQGLLGHIVMIEAKAGRLHAAIDPRLAMALVAVLDGSKECLDQLRSVRRLTADETRLMQIAMTAASFTSLSKKQREVILQFMAANTHRVLSGRQLLIFLPFAGPSQRVVARYAAVWALKHAYEYRDVTTMAQCVNAISEFSPTVLINWFSKYYPVSFSMEGGIWKAKVKKAEAVPNRLSDAACDPF